MDAVFGLEIDALIGGEFQADDGWARPSPSRTQYPACPDYSGELRIFDRRYEGGDHPRMQGTGTSSAIVGRITPCCVVSESPTG
jgi:hypothetical protein